VYLTLKGQPHWPRDWNFLYFHYVENWNMAFSLTILKMPVVNALAVVAIAFIIYYLWRYKDIAWLPSLGMAFILGGAFGNIPERIITGYVVDWISVEWPDWLLFTRWPSFNVADASVSVGIVMYLIYILFVEERPAPAETSSNSES